MTLRHPPERDRASLPPPRRPGRPYRICVVCAANICRSPMAESVLRAEIGRAGIGGLVEIDSAAIGDWRVGEGMDPRARTELARRGYPVPDHRARQFGPSWFAERDLVLAMDWHVMNGLRYMAAGRPDVADRTRLLRSFDPASPDGAEVPDPYVGDARAFTHALELIEAAATHIAALLAQRLTGTGR